MNLPTTSQTYAFGRHVVSFAGGAVFYASVFGVVNATDAASANHAIAQIGDGFKEIVAGVSVLVPIAMGVFAAAKSSPFAQMLMGAAALIHGKVNPAAVSPADQKTIMIATSTLPKVASIATTDKAIADSTPPKISLWK